MFGAAGNDAFGETGICMSGTISVVIVDDSAFMRKSLAMLLESDPAIKVVATARDGKEGIEKIREFKPDIVTMDIEMPVMTGLEALAIIMKEMPLPVLMVSSLTTEGSDKRRSMRSPSERSISYRKNSPTFPSISSRLKPNSFRK